MLGDELLWPAWRWNNHHVSIPNRHLGIGREFGSDHGSRAHVQSVFERHQVLGNECVWSTWQHRLFLSIVRGSFRPNVATNGRTIFASVFATVTPANDATDIASDVATDDAALATAVDATFNASDVSAFASALSTTVNPADASADDTTN